MFQEGEDLHTFCDNVVHYGISASPIALEQKVGRVDRIGSLSHRAMLGAGDGYREHFIQVGFPHIRESLEFLQVRAAAHNLNQFLHSLQRVEGIQAATDTAIEITSGLLDPGAIEPAVATLLKSPFTIGPEWLAGAERAALDAELKALAARRSHCSALVGATLEQLAGAAITAIEADGSISWEMDNGLSVALRGAQGDGQLILGASRPAPPLLESATHSAAALLASLRRLQADSSVRLQLPERELGALRAALEGTLIANAEIYAGGAGILHACEVSDLHARLMRHGSLAGTATSEAHARVASLLDSLCGRHGAYQVSRGADDTLDYHFTFEERRQRVCWELHGGYVLVQARVLAPQQALLLAGHPDLLLAHTLGRNRRFDVVDFHVDADQGLSVRALHPLGHLNREELDFICHQVAANAQRLRQVLSHPGDDDIMA